MKTSLGDVLAAMEALAPVALAEPWDNVGLLVDATTSTDGSDEPGRGEEVRAVALTIDLTEDVLEEARGLGANVVVAYHPPIFQPLTRLSRRSTKERVVLEAVRRGMSVYSPHTALDAAEGGVNDWLAQALGEGPRTPISPTEGSTSTGLGRRLELDEPASLDVVVARIKQHLGLERVRVAACPEHTSGALVERGFVCAGAGGAVLSSVEESGLLLTGEMRHHDVAAKVAAGSSVVLCDHTNTERGYLPILARRLAEALDGSTKVEICRRDRDPLQIV